MNSGNLRALKFRLVNSEYWTKHIHFYLREVNTEFKHRYKDAPSTQGSSKGSLQNFRDKVGSV